MQQQGLERFVAHLATSAKALEPVDMVCTFQEQSQVGYRTGALLCTSTCALLSLASKQVYHVTRTRELCGPLPAAHHSWPCSSGICGARVGCPPATEGACGTGQ